MCLWMILCEVHCPDARARSGIKNSFEIGMVLVWRSEANFAAEGQLKKFVLEIYIVERRFQEFRETKYT